MTSEKEKGLDFIESIIASLRDASFKCKEFSILICSVFLTIFATVNPTPKIMVLLCAPVLLLFWVIDSFYLMKERNLRKEYKRIVLLECTEGDVSPLLFNTKLPFFEAIKRFLSSMFVSISTTLLYVPLISSAIVFGILLINGNI